MANRKCWWMVPKLSPPILQLSQLSSHWKKYIKVCYTLLFTWIISCGFFLILLLNNFFFLKKKYYLILDCVWKLCFITFLFYFYASFINLINLVFFPRFQTLTLDLLKVRLYNFFLISMNLSQSHDSGREFNRLTRIDSCFSGYFF
jgi:hypothetical protein